MRRGVCLVCGVSVMRVCRVCVPAVVCPSAPNFIVIQQKKALAQARLWLIPRLPSLVLDVAVVEL